MIRDQLANRLQCYKPVLAKCLLVRRLLGADLRDIFPFTAGKDFPLNASEERSCDTGLP